MTVIDKKKLYSSHKLSEDNGYELWKKKGIGEKKYYIKVGVGKWGQKHILLFFQMLL